jgi:hypothetical protein
MSESLQEITQQIIGQMPPQTRFRADDPAIIHQHQAFLLSLEDDIVAGFYNTLFAHPPTAAIFSAGERPAREQTLRDWWQRTVTGTFNDEYWVWQTLVGLIHVKREVKNPMMIAMWGWVLNTLGQASQSQLPADQANALMGAMERLAATCQSLTAESYLEHYLIALRDATGFNQKLLDQMVRTGVEDLLQQRS